MLQALNALHVWAPGFLEQRLKWRGAQPITVLELRATRLAQPLVVPPQEAFFGCFSWVDLGASPEAAAAATAHHGAPALDDAAFGMAQGLCRQQLHRLADLRELVF